MTNSTEVKEKRFKCFTCHSIVTLTPGEDCPKCQEKAKNLIEVCPNDHCNCSHEIIFSLAYCPLCGEAMCPECGCHDVAQISRVTGYLQDVAGWNPAKAQELKDRTRYNIA
jgi:hypothetical protein